MASIEAITARFGQNPLYWPRNCHEILEAEQRDREPVAKKSKINLPGTLEGCRQMYNELSAERFAGRAVTGKAAAREMESAYPRLCARLADLRSKDDQAARLAAALNRDTLTRSTPPMITKDFPRLKAEWDAAIRANIKAGMGPDAAISAAARDNRELGRQLIEAANAPAAPKAITFTPAAITAFNSVVAQEQAATGRPRHEAVRTVCVRQPELRNAYVAAVNEQKIAAVA